MPRRVVVSLPLPSCLYSVLTGQLDEPPRGAHDRRAKKRRLAGPEGRSSAPALPPRASLANAFGRVNRLGCCVSASDALPRMLPDRPSAFHPEQARAFGGINDALFFHSECALRRGVCLPFPPPPKPLPPALSASNQRICKIAVGSGCHGAVAALAATRSVGSAQPCRLSAPCCGASSAGGVSSRRRAPPAARKHGDAGLLSVHAKSVPVRVGLAGARSSHQAMSVFSRSRR
jgi:hypothetical protein